MTFASVFLKGHSKVINVSSFILNSYDLVTFMTFFLYRNKKGVSVEGGCKVNCNVTK